jgi:hypothetical protein
MKTAVYWLTKWVLDPLDPAYDVLIMLACVYSHVLSGVLF